MESADRPARLNRRGRPQKYGQPSQVVAVTLPRDVIDVLRGMHSDLGWAIVGLVEKSRRVSGPSPSTPEAELVEIGDGQRLIVVNTSVFHSLPGVQMVPLSETQAFLALEPGQGMADLELAVIDQIERPGASERDRRALVRLRDLLRRWRRDTHLHFQSRAIILVSGRGKPPRSRT